MATGGGQVVCNLKAARKAKGISQSGLAARIGVKRQAIYDMETGRYVPNTILALRMAKVLGCKVEDLFALPEAEEEQEVSLADIPAAPHTRVSVARVREKLVAYPVDGKWLMSEGFRAADGILSQDCTRVRFLEKAEQAENKILLLGCDPAFAILAAHASRWAVDASVHCRFASSYRAMERLAGGYAHIAGTHLHNRPSTEANVTLAAKFLAGSNALVMGFSLFEEGLMVASGNPKGIRTVSDLARMGIRFVNREKGAALRILLDDRLQQAGLTGDNIAGYDNTASTHDICAQMVAFGMADAAMGLRAVASAHGLDFVPIESVRCDLVIPNDFLDLPGIRILLDVLQSRSLRHELSALPGYESSCTGQLVGQVNSTR